jgi:hypothetical protein
MKIAAGNSHSLFALLYLVELIRAIAIAYKFHGAGRESRTLVLSLGRTHNCRYTIPAGATSGIRTPDLSFTKAAL